MDENTHDQAKLEASSSQYNAQSDKDLSAYLLINLPHSVRLESCFDDLCLHSITQNKNSNRRYLCADIDTMNQRLVRYLNFTSTRDSQSSPLFSMDDDDIVVAGRQRLVSGRRRIFFDIVVDWLFYVTNYLCGRFEQKEKLLFFCTI